MTTTISPARHRSLGDHTWHDKAACQPIEYNLVDPDIFFPEPDEMDKIHAAKRLCAQCPVSKICLDAALEHGDTYGIRGGLTEQERGSLHENLSSRLDYSRVNATLAGRDVHLTKAERTAVVNAAYRDGISVQRLAWLLKITVEHAQRLYRETRQALSHRDLQEKAGTGQPPEPGAERSLTRDDFGTAA